MEVIGAAADFAAFMISTLELEFLLFLKEKINSKYQQLPPVLMSDDDMSHPCKLFETIHPQARDYH